MMFNNDIFLVSEQEGSRYLTPIVSFLFSYFSQLFLINTAEMETCIIFNDPEAPCPMLITNCTPIKIRLAQESLDYWAQTVFQLSHELCHYVMRQCRTEKDFIVSWFEEIICEAVSLLALEYAYKNWEKCGLYKLNPNFDESLHDYLVGELNKSGTDVFSKCTSIELLSRYEQSMTDDRETHRNERNETYKILSADPNKLKILCSYPEYVNPNHLTLDFDTWVAEKPCKLLLYLREIQPIKETTNV